MNGSEKIYIGLSEELGEELRVKPCQHCGIICWGMCRAVCKAV